MGNKMPPKSLYRYRSFKGDNKEDHALLALKNSLITFAKAEKMNDLFEAELYIIRETLEELAKKHAQNIAKESGYRDLKHVLSINKDLTYKACIESAQNDLIAKVNVFKNVFYIASFTEDKSNMPMWAHYANNHTGYVIEYNSNDLLNAINSYRETYHKDIVNYNDTLISLLPVNYDGKFYDGNKLFEDYVNSNCFNTKSEFYRNLKYNINLFKSLALNKVSDWSYEKEWRLLVGNDYEKNIHPYYSMEFKVKPTCIYMGIKISEENKKKLLEIAKKLSISIKQMQIEGKNKKIVLTYK